MALSIKAKEELDYTYLRSTSTTNINLMGGINSLFNHNAYNLFLVFDKKKDSFEIPVSHKTECTRILNLLENNTKEEQYIIPIYTTSYVSFSTFNQLLKSRTSNNLLEIKKDNKKEFYYNRGFILDEDYTPLFMTSISFKYDTSLNKYSVDKLLCRINPIVFSKNTPLYKFIRKELLQYYASNSFNYSIVLNYKIYHDDDCLYKKVSIIIEPFDYMFKKVAPPRDIPNINNTINNYLSDNVDTLLNMVQCNVYY